jgi:iron complex outermembrane recepter protein
MRKCPATLLFGWVLMAWIGTDACSEEPLRQECDEIVVTATRSERPTEDIPAAVSAVTEETLKDLPLLGPKEAFSGLAGVQSETKNGGYDTRLIIRGAGLKARYGVREIMILLDGVPITDPDGMSRLDFVDTQLIERIDIVRGPNSTLYGANAAGGVVNIITRNPFEERKSLTLGYGSDNTQLYSGIYGTGFDQSYLTLAATHKQTDSWREWNEFRSNQGSLKLGHLFVDGATLETNLSYTQADLQLPGTLTKEQFSSDPSQLTSEPFRHSGRYSKVFSASLKYEKELGAWRIKPLGYLQDWSHYHPVPGLINDGGATVAGIDLQASRRHRLFRIDSELILGVAGQIDDGDGDKYTYRDLETDMTGKILATLSDKRGELAETDSDRISKWGVYLQESLRPNDRWIIDGGVRYDQVRFDLSSTVRTEFIWGANRYVTYPVPLEVRVKKNFDYVSPRLGAVYHVSPQTSLYGNISTGFQTPQSSELGDNRDLDPSTTYNYEIGLKNRLPGGHRFDIAIFYQQVKDEIIQTLLEGGQSSYSNAGQTDRRGIETSGEVCLPYDVRLGGAYTYSDFTFDSFVEPVSVFNPETRTTERVLFDRSGNRLPYIPRHQYSLYLFYRHQRGFKTRVSSDSWGSYWVDNANSERYPGYDFITNLMVGWEWVNWDLVVDISNLFDKRYAIEVTKDGSELAYRPGAPRSLFAKLTFHY